jgi:RHS repeat-associated protein
VLASLPGCAAVSVSYAAKKGTPISVGYECVRFEAGLKFDKVGNSPEMREEFGRRIDESPFSSVGRGWFEFDLRFPGQIAMAETGLSCNYCRDYDSATGRYIRSDPIELKGGINPYAYTYASPTMFTDPNGLQVSQGCSGANGTVVCDGQGGFEIRNCNQTCTRPCTQRHEETHVADHQREPPNRCRNKKKGESPSVEDDFKAAGGHYYYASECRAYRVSLACAEAINAEGCCDPAIVDQYIQTQKNMIKYYRCIYK